MIDLKLTYLKNNELASGIKAPISEERQVQATNQDLTPEVTWNGNKIEIIDVLRNMLRQDKEYLSDKYLKLRGDAANILESLIKSHPAVIRECREQVQAEPKKTFTEFVIPET